MKQDATILIVDDDKSSIKLITKMLNKNGYAIDSCLTGEEALEKVKRIEYDLVLLDVKLGKGIDGYEVCRRILHIKNDLPIILVTAHHDDDSINKGFLIGSSDYIKKPISQLELLARVNKTINFKRSERRNLQLIYDLSKNIETAASIQEAMLPKWIYLDRNMIFSSHYEPYEAVGGDLFDRIKISDDLYVVYMGDISGHGVQAALLMTAVKSIIKIMVENDRDNVDLPRLVTKLNERLSNELFIFDNYLTLLIGIIDLKKNEFRYMNAGHPPVVVIDTKSGAATAMESTGSLPLGWLPNQVYYNDDMGAIPINEQNIILLFSDGIYECVNKNGTQFGIAGVLNTLRHEIKVDSCISLPYRIKQYLVDHKYNISFDDFTLFAFQKRKNQEHIINDANCKEIRPAHYMTTLQAALKEVGKTAIQCEDIVMQSTCNKTLAAKVELIIDEFLSNIIKYGYNYSEDAAVVVEFSIHDRNLKIKFWDKGIYWTPEENHYSIDNPYNFDKDVYNTDGRGVKIIMSMSNKFHRTRYDKLNETTVDIEITEDLDEENPD
ncbi:MAG: SpoIIE family protein phosphatase [Candidatus Cloacimonadaceae bacterium]